MKHSELLKLEEAPEFIHGIEIDGDQERFLTGLKEIGIISQMEDGGLDLSVIDACIAYIANGTNVILEVPFEQDFDAQTLIIEAMATEFDISLLPPYDAEDREEEQAQWEKYSEKLQTFTSAWLSQPNTKRMVYPVSGFLGYMVGEELGYQPDSITKDSYIDKVYVENIPVEIMDEIKDELRLVIYEAFGGKDEFEKYCHSLAYTAANSFPHYENDTKRFFGRIRVFFKKKWAAIFG